MEDNCCVGEDRKISETKGLHTEMSDLRLSKRSRLVVEQRCQQLKRECCDRVKQTWFSPVLLRSSWLRRTLVIILITKLTDVWVFETVLCPSLLENDKRCCVPSVSLCVFYSQDAETDISVCLAIYTVNHVGKHQNAAFSWRRLTYKSRFFGDSNFFIRLGQHSCRTKRNTATQWMHSIVIYVKHDFFKVHRIVHIHYSDKVEIVFPALRQICSEHRVPNFIRIGRVL